MLNLTSHTHHSTSMNQDAMRTPKQFAHHERNCKTNWCFDGRRSPILRRNDALRYRSAACIRLSYLAQERLDLAERAKRLAQRMSEPRYFDFVPLKRAARYQVRKPQASLRIRRQKHVDQIAVFVDSNFVGDPVLRKSTTGLAQIGSHTLKSGSTLQSLTALSVGEAEFYAVVKGGQVGVSLRSIYQDLGIPMKIEIQSDSSTSKSLTDRLRAGQRTKHIDTRYFCTQERVQDGDLSITKVLTAKQMLERSHSLLQYYNNIAGMVFY